MEHHEHYKGYDFIYHFKDDKSIPTGLRIEPIFDYDSGEVIGFNVSGVYGEDTQKLLNTPIIDQKELFKRVMEFYK